MAENKLNPTKHISVVLPVYNGQTYLAEAIESVLNQSYTKFELIIINDGSSDSSDEIIRSFKDSRIKYLHQQNKGLGATLNEGLKLASGSFIARQDQDDLSYPKRFEKQISFLEKHPEIIMCGTWARIIKENDGNAAFHKHSSNSALLHLDMLFDNPFVHSSVMFRKEALNKAGYYTIDRNVYEDYDLWSRFLQYGQLANLPEVLLDYRHHQQGLSKNFQHFKDDALYSQGLKNIATLLKKEYPVALDLPAVYHYKQAFYKGTSYHELIKGLTAICEALIKLYPHQKQLIVKRKQSYEKVIRYRLNVLKINDTKSSFVTKILSKLDNKLHSGSEFAGNGNH